MLKGTRQQPVDALRSEFVAFLQFCSDSAESLGISYSIILKIAAYIGSRCSLPFRFTSGILSF
jgi:hypothetical protein